MNENEQILQQTIESLKEEFAGNGQIEVSTIRFLDLDYPGQGLISADCSGVCTELDEGIYYDRDRQHYFFHGEPHEFSYGGNKRTIAITVDLLSLLPTGLQAALLRVGTTGHPEVIRFSQSPLLE